MQTNQERFLIRKYQHMITSIGTQFALGIISKKDMNELEKAIALFKKVGYTGYIRECKTLLESALKARKRKHLTVIK